LSITNLQPALKRLHPEIKSALHTSAAFVSFISEGKILNRPGARWRQGKILKETNPYTQLYSCVKRGLFALHFYNERSQKIC